MVSLRSIPPIAVVQAVARNGAQHQNHSTQNMRHAFAVRGQNLPMNDQESEKQSESENESGLDSHAIKRLFSEVEKRHKQLRFELHKSSGRVVVSVIDRETGELIRQIPSEVAIAAAERLNSVEPGEMQSGTFLSSKT